MKRRALALLSAASVVYANVAACRGDACAVEDDRCEGDARVICLDGREAMLSRDVCPREGTCVIDETKAPICARKGAPTCGPSGATSCEAELLGTCTALADGRLVWVDKRCRGGQACRVENGIALCP